MVYLQHWSPGGCVTVLLKNLQRWRADDIRPYADGATELPPQKFRCANEVLRDLLCYGTSIVDFLIFFSGGHL